MSDNLPPTVGDKVVYARPLPAEGNEGAGLRRLRVDPSVVVDADPATGEIAVYDAQSLTNLYWDAAEAWRVVAKADYLDVLSKADGAAQVIPARPRASEANPSAVSDPKRVAYTAGLQQLAGLLVQHPEFPLPYEGQAGRPLMVSFFGGNPREDMAAAARAFPGPLSKSGTDKYFDLNGQLAGLHVELTAHREEVCERVVVGVETVTKQVPDPAVVVPTVEVTEQVERVEWRCRPVLAAVQSEQAGDVR